MLLRAPATPPPEEPNTFDDVFGDSHEQQREDPSDIPRLRTVHVTAGYRDGIAASKANHVQDGFDEGYTLGAVLGLRVGYILGVLNGVLRAVLGKHMLGPIEVAEDWAEEKNEIRRICSSAKEELSIQNMFGKEWFGEDGIWTFKVEGREEYGEVTFRDVAAAHPLIRKWDGIVDSHAKRCGLDLKIVEAGNECEKQEGEG